MIKLVNFHEHAEFNRLRAAMRAPLVGWSASVIRLDKKESKILSEGFMDWEIIGDAPVDADGLLTYKGQRVAVYIRDQYGTNEYRYHVSDCGTLKSMRRGKRYHTRYVMTTRDDGKFLVYNVDSYDYKRTGNSALKELKLCQNCWHYLKTIGQTAEWDDSYTQFDLSTYLSRHGSQISTLPTHNEITAPSNVYSDRHKVLASQMKRNRGYRCELCGIKLDSRKYLLHLHHIDGMKSNNSPQNLQVLCAKCHAEQPNHSHLKSKPGYLEVLKLSNRSQ